jgi:hypothetical protein
MTGSDRGFCRFIRRQANQRTSWFISKIGNRIASTITSTTTPITTISKGSSRLVRRQHAVFHFAALLLGGALQHVHQSAARLAAGDHVDQHRREQLRGGQRAAEAAALAHPARGLFHRLPHRYIVHHPGAGLQRRQQRHPAADQDGQRARQLRAVDATHHRPTSGSRSSQR